MAQYLPEHFAGPVVMDFVDVDSAKFATYAEQDGRQPLHWVHARDAVKLGAYETRVARAVDPSLFVREPAALLFRQRSRPDAVREPAVCYGRAQGFVNPPHPFEEVGRGDGALAR